jgi:hypothetical protein
MSAATVRPIAKPPTFGALGSTAVPEDDERQEERRDQFEKECLSCRDVERDRLAAALSGGEQGSRHGRLEGVRRRDRTEHLGGDVDRGHHRFDAARHEKAIVTAGLR